MYWRHGGVLLHTCHSSWVAYTRDLMVCSCIHGPYEVARTGDLVACSCIHVTHRGWHVLETQWHALAYMSLTVGGTYWRLSDVLLRTCHSLWVAPTGDLVVCSWVHVTRCGWHILET
ncbi:hypothetical protein AAZX31_15G192300 [Glycine max]